MALTLNQIWKWRKAPWGNSFRPMTKLEMIETARGKLSGANFQWNKKRKVKCGRDLTVRRARCR